MRSVFCVGWRSGPLALTFAVVFLFCIASAVRGQSLDPRSRVTAQLPGLAQLPDRSAELQRRIDQAGGRLSLSDPVYRITKPLIVDLEKNGASGIFGEGNVTLVMDGDGPALVIRGSHQGTASPKSFKPTTWNQRMPVIEGLEILGASESADGVLLEGTVGAILQRVSVRWCRHGIHLADRNRNVIISACHVYENQGIGVFLDDVNLHQINVIGSHISYNQGGGVVLRDGNVRNLQVTGCDIEANMPFDETPTTTANIWIDVSGSKEDRSRSIAEISISGCTIQHSANYSGDEGKTVAPGGANIRLSGKEIYPIDSVTITGNVISDTSVNVDLLHVMDVTISANNFFAPKPSNIRVSHGYRVVLQGNTFNPRQFVRPGVISFTDSNDCLFANSTLHHFATGDGAIQVQRCKGLSLSGLVLSDCGSGVRVEDSEKVLVTGCLFRGTQKGPDLFFGESCREVVLEGNLTTSGVSVAESALVP